MGVGAAIIGSAVLGAGTSLYGGSQQTKAAKAGLRTAQGQYQQTRADLAPWRKVGAAATYELGALHGLPVDYPTTPQTAPQTTPQRTPQRNRLFDFNQITDQGRNGDTEIAHVTPGEVVVPARVAQQPEVQNRLYDAFNREGLDPERYRVGGRNSVNPLTGRPEFFTERDHFPGNSPPGEMNRDGPDRLRRRFQRPEQVNQPAPVPNDYYDQDRAIDRFYRSPEFRLPFEEGGRQIEASAAGRGGLFSGNTGRALVQYGQDLAANQYNNYWNHLMGLSTGGQNAAAQTGSMAPNFGPYYGAMGQGYADMGIGINNAIQGGIGNYLYYQGVRPGNSPYDQTDYR